MKKYSVCIIGGGSIGGLKKDKYDSPKTKNILTHAHAVFEHKKTKLIGIVDINEEQGKKAAKKWFTDHYFNLNQIKEKIDIIIISVPTEYHLEIITEAVVKKPKLIIVEKPFTMNTEEAIRAKKILSGIPTIINYSRRFDNKINTVIKNVIQKTYHCKITYRRGLIRDGAHAIDYMRYCFGQMKRGYILREKEYITDLCKEDPTYSVYMEFEKCPHVFLAGVDSEKYSVFDIDFFTDKGRFTLTDHSEKLVINTPIKEETWGGHKVLLFRNRTIIETGITQTTLMNLLNNAIRVIEKKEKIICDVNDGIRTHLILKFLLETI